MEIAYGHTAITCKNCGTMTAIDNKTLEVLAEHICPSCNTRMTDRELGAMKMHLFLLWSQIYDAHCGPIKWLFDYDIDLHPHVK